MTKRTKEKYHEEYLRRKTRGRHPEEIRKYGETLPKRTGIGKVPYEREPMPTYVKAPKSILDIAKETWNLFSYVDIFQFYYSLNTRDVTKATNVERVKNELFELHKFFREFFKYYFSVEEKGLIWTDANIDEINIESDIQREIQGRFRYFEFLYIDEEAYTRVFFLQYWKGRIRRSHMPAHFWSQHFSDFLRMIKKINKWE